MTTPWDHGFGPEKSGSRRRVEDNQPGILAGGREETRSNQCSAKGGHSAALVAARGTQQEQTRQARMASCTDPYTVCRSSRDQIRPIRESDVGNQPLRGETWAVELLVGLQEALKIQGIDHEDV